MTALKKVAKDTYLFRDGDTPDAMYLVKSGVLAITKTKGNSEIVLAEISTGSMVGEMALFDRKPRSANVKAVKDTEVVCLPYDALEKQMDALPVWVKAILKTLNENLREANKKIKTLENASSDGERFPPHVVNKLLTLINLVGHRFGQKDADGSITVPPMKLRNYTIQIFQEATNKMDSMQQALKELGFMKIEDLGEGKKKLINLKPDFLVEFVDWYNEWLYKQEKDRVQYSYEDVLVLEGLIHFGKKLEAHPKGYRKLNLSDLQNDSMKELGRLIKADDVNPLVEKKIISEKVMDEGGVFVHLYVEELEKPYHYWKLVWELKKHLK